MTANTMRGPPFYFPQQGMLLHGARRDTVPNALYKALCSVDLIRAASTKVKLFFSPHRVDKGLKILETWALYF